MSSVVHSLAGLSPVVSILLKLTIILAAAWTLHGVLLRANPGWRVLLWRTVVFGSLLVPVLMPLGYFQVTIAPPEQSAGFFQHTLPEDSSHVAAPGTLHVSEPSEEAATAAATSSPGKPWLGGIGLAAVARIVWLATALVLALRLMAGSFALRRGIGTSHAAPDHLQRLLSRVAVELGCTEAVSLRYAGNLPSPYLARVRKPVIVIPERMTHPSFAKELPVVLAHEVAHLRAGDLFWGGAARWLSVLLWFHPLVWRLRDAHSAACEEVCDAVAATYLGDAAAYSKTLARVALGFRKHSSPAGSIPMARSSEVTGRLKKLRKHLHAPLARRSVVLALSLALVALVSFSGLGLVYAERPVAGPWKARVLHFPARRSMGAIAIETDRNANWNRINQDEGQNEWAYIADARGHVSVPAGKRVGLDLSRDPMSDLSPLEQLGSDDLQKLSFPYVPDGEVRPGDSCMPPIAHLTGLEILDLRFTAITGAGLGSIHALTSLKHLVLSNEIPGSALAHLAGFASLESLELHSDRVSDGDLAHLASVTSLKRVTLKSGTGIKGHGFVHLTRLPSLEDLTLWRGDVPLDDSALEHVGQIPSLRRLDLRRDLPVTDAGMAHLAGLTQLEDLRIFDNSVTDAGLLHLRDMRGLKRLGLDQTEVTDAGLAYLLPKLPALESLSLPWEITDDGLAFVAQCPRLKRLWAGSRSDGPISDAGLAHLSNCLTLDELSIGGAGITDAGLAHIAKLSNLTHLSLFYTSPEASNEGLAHLDALDKLTMLSLPRDTEMTASGLSKLSLPHLANLQAGGLRVDGKPVDISGLSRLEMVTLPEVRDEDLASVASLPRLRWLQLAWANSISDAGIAHLAGLTGLERLTIGGPETTDAGLAHLAGMDKLNYLFISGDFTDEGLRRLEGLKALRYLNFHDAKTRFSPAAIQHLRDELPLLSTLNVNTPTMGRRGSSSARRSARGG